MCYEVLQVRGEGGREQRLRKMWLLFWIMVFSFPPPGGCPISSLSLLPTAWKDNLIHLNFPSLCGDASQLPLFLFWLTHFDVRGLPTLCVLGNNTQIFRDICERQNLNHSEVFLAYESAILSGKIISLLIKNSINRTLGYTINLHCVSMSLLPKWV